MTATLPAPVDANPEEWEFAGLFVDMASSRVLPPHGPKRPALHPRLWVEKSYSMMLEHPPEQRSEYVVQQQVTTRLSILLRQAHMEWLATRTAYVEPPERVGVEWVPAPVNGEYGQGRRWRLDSHGKEMGRVVQLMPGGLWEARSWDWYAPGYRTLREAANALLAFLLRDVPFQGETLKT